MSRASGYSLRGLLIALALSRAPCVAQVGVLEPPPRPTEEMPWSRDLRRELELRSPTPADQPNLDRGDRRLTPGTARSSDGPFAGLLEAERQNSERLRRIQHKLDRLQRLMKSRKQNPRQPDEAQAGPPTPAARTADDVQQPTKEQANDHVFRATEPPPSRPAPAAAPIAAPPVHLTSTVDRLALANNLFAQGKTDIACPLYEELFKVPQTPLDHIWIQYQLASCYRILGDIENATKHYRAVAGSKKDEYWQARALWWLDYLRRTTNVIKQRQELETQLDALRKSTHGLPSQ